MPRWMREYLFRTDLRTHLKRALLLGLIARVCSAVFVYGPQALDDYKHGVWPAYQFFAGLPLDIPEYRSHLLIWLLALFAKVGSYLGVESALGQVRAMYLGLGLVSLCGIYGTYLYVQNFKSRVFAALALYLAAIFPLMPFVSTRAFGEAVALALVMLGIGMLERARHARDERVHVWMLAFGVVALAGLFRFHVGLIYLAYMGVLARRKVWRGFAAAAVTGALAILAQGLIDVLSGKTPLRTLIVYLLENEGGGAKYGVSPWYNPWLFVLAISLAPFSFVLVKSLKSLWRKHWPILVPLLVFVGAHSLAAHKEERFLYPILGLEIWAIAWLWAANAFNPYARKVYTGAVLVLSALLLPVVCLVNTQEGEIEPPALAESRYGQVIYLDHESLFGKSRFKFYFLRPPSELREVQPTEFNAARVDEELANHRGARAVVMLTSEPESLPQLEALESIRTLEARCLEVQASGSVIDKLLYSMNPKHNQRRRPTWYLVCERSSNV